MRFWCSNPLTEKSERECFGKTCQTAQDEIPNVILLLAPSFLLDESIQSHIQSICRWQVAKEVDCRWARVSAHWWSWCRCSWATGMEEERRSLRKMAQSRNHATYSRAILQTVNFIASICKTSHRSKNQLKRKTNISFNEALLNQLQGKKQYSINVTCADKHIEKLQCYLGTF